MFDMLFVVFVFQFEVFVNIFTTLECSFGVGFIESIPIWNNDRVLAVFKLSELDGHDWLVT